MASLPNVWESFYVLYTPDWQEMSMSIEEELLFSDVAT